MSHAQASGAPLRPARSPDRFTDNKIACDAGIDRWLALLIASATCHAQTAAYPSKPVKLVVGFAAGGPTDVVARAFADHASRALGQAFIIDNKPGANTILAAQAVAGAPADGYTLLFGATNHTMIPGLYSGRVKFDAVKSFKPLCTVATSPTVLVVGPSLPVASLADYMTRAQGAGPHHGRHGGHG
jgi:tripartite-type tricarboxylate transporter receptor subunit TctC